MKNVAEQIAAWYQDNVKPAELDKKVEATLEYVKRFNQPDEGGEWNVWAYEIVDGHHGQYTVRIFLNELTQAKDTPITELRDWTQVEDQDEVLGTFDQVSVELARLFNEGSNLPGNFWVGHNENDGSLGVTYSVRA